VEIRLINELQWYSSECITAISYNKICLLMLCMIMILVVVELTDALSKLRTTRL